MKTGIARFDERSAKNLEGVHPDLVKVVERAAELCEIDFVVIEGLRTMKRQRKLVAMGASKTLKSRHLTGHAVDIVPIIDDEPSFAWPPIWTVVDAMRAAAAELKIDVEHGAEWRTFKDGPHHQLSFKAYPA